MNTKILLMGAVASIALVGTAQAHSWYVGLETGANIVEDVDAVGTISGPPVVTGVFTMDSGWSLIGTVGHEFSKDWRVEGELGYRENATDSGGTIEVTQLSLMVNVLYDISISPSADFSLGFGAGYDQTTFSIGNAEADDSDFAWQGIIGANWAVGSSTDLTITYRYTNVSGPSLSAGAGIASIEFDDVTQHTISVGLRFKMDDDGEE